METEDALENEDTPEKSLLSHHSMKVVMTVHQQLCLSFARSLWYQQTLPSHQAKHHLSTFLACYQTGASLVAHFYPLIGKACIGRGFRFVHAQGCLFSLHVDFGENVLQNTVNIPLSALCSGKIGSST